MAADDYDKPPQIVEVHGLKFLVDSRMTNKRAHMAFKKERATIEWIDGMGPGRFIDVGANIGNYTLYAASKGHSVEAYEPEPRNFARLVQNLYLNDLDHLVEAWPFAVGAEEGISTIQIKGDEAGKAKHRVGRGDCAVPVRKLEPGTYLKMDTDGDETKIVMGNLETVSKFKSAIIEINPGQLELVDIMRGLGFYARQVGGMMGDHPDYCGNWLFESRSS